MAYDVAIIINGDINILAQNTIIKGTAIRTYEAFNDAPEEKEYEWTEEDKDTWLTNIANGVAVTGLFIVGAVAIVGSCGTATPAVIGAGACIVGGSAVAGVTTVNAIEDYGGPVRSVEQNLTEILTAGAIGAVAGAIITGLVIAAPYVAVAVPALIPANIPEPAYQFLQKMAPKAAQAGGYVLAGLQALRFGSMLDGRIYGNDWLLDTVFGGNSDNYGTAKMLLDLATGVYLLEGIKEYENQKKNPGTRKDKGKNKEEGNSKGTGGVGRNLTDNFDEVVSDIIDINKKYSDGYQMNNSIESIVNSASYYDDPYDQVSAVTRGITDHAFVNGNKRTAFDTLNMLLDDLGLQNNLSDAQKWDLINNIAEGRLKEIEEISRILRGY